MEKSNTGVAKIKKFVSLLLSFFVCYSFIFADVIRAMAIPQIKPPAALNTNMPYGVISDSFISDKNKDIIVFIQDLHTNPSVQKNIAKIIENLDKTYGIDKILIEGAPNGKIDTTFLMNIKRYNLSNSLLNKGILTGTEYYLLNNDSPVGIYGLENWNVYLSNVKKAAEILRDRKYIYETFSKFEETVSINIKNSKSLMKYVNFELEDEKLLKNVNRPVIKYKDLHKYVQLAYGADKLDIKTINKEHNNFIKELQSKIQFKDYKNILDKYKKQNLNDYYASIYDEFNKEKNYYSEKYKNLRQFLEYTSQKTKINSISLISERNEYFKDYLNSIHGTNNEESIFVLKMTQLFGSFLKLSVSEEEYEYFTNNYERYVNLLQEYLGKDFEEYEDLLYCDQIFDYHRINKDRNNIFFQNILNSLKQKDKNKEITVIVAGGFHTSILKNLKEKNISFFLVTPSVESSNINDSYKEIILSALNDNFSNQTLAQIPIMLINNTSVPEGIRYKYFQKLVDSLCELENNGQNSPEHIKSVIIRLAEENLIFDSPISVQFDDDNFNIIIGKETLHFDILDGKVLWEKEEKNAPHEYKRERDLKGKITAFIKRKFNILQATSMQLNPASSYSSKIMSKRTGLRSSFIFSLSMFFSTLKFNKLSYDLMSGFAYSLRKKAVKHTMNFEGKSIDVFVEKGLSKYITENDLRDILKEAALRIDEPVTHIKDTIFIGFLSKSTNLFEDHLNNGFIGVNEGIMQVKDELVKKAFIKAGIIHEISHEFKGELDSSRYKSFEERMMFSDMKFIIEYIAKEEYGKDTDYKQILYTEKFDSIVDRIIEVLLTPVYEPSTKKSIPLFTENIRFVRKFKNYKYNIDDITSFVKRKDFSIEGRRGQLKHIENSYLKDDPQLQEKLFSGLIEEPENEGTMQDFLKEYISPERRKEVADRINEMLSNLEAVLNSSDIKETNPELTDKILAEFKNNIYSCLELMYKKMPKYIFGKFYNEQAVIADHSLNHSIEVLNSAVKILSREISSVETLDIQALVYSALLHDVSCSLLRINHEENSATWAKSILKDALGEKRAQEIADICIGHCKGIKDPKTEYEKILSERIQNSNMTYFESRLLRDSDGLSAALDLKRILGVWLTHKELLINEDLTIDERINLIKSNKYLTKDGGDAVNDLIRQFLRRDPDLYLTTGAREIIQASRSNPYAVREFINSANIRNEIKNAGIGVKDEDIDKSIQIIDEVLSKMIPGYRVTETAENLYDGTSGESSFGIKEKFSLLKQIISYLSNKKFNFKQNIAISDIHGGYARLIELIVNLIDPTYNTEGRSDKQIEEEILSRLSYTGNNNIFYFLGDMLDRGSRQVESFEFINKFIKSGKAKYVIGNHDLYAFMNLLGLHLPSYKNYKGIKSNYFDFKHRNIKDLLENKRIANAYGVNDKNHWILKLNEYMKYADLKQKKWNGQEIKLQELFTKTFGFVLDGKGNDVLNKPEKEFAKDEILLNFHKKFFGRNVGIVVYTGIRAVNKMSINWWIDRKEELHYLKNRYPQYSDYWLKLENLITDILSEQETKMDEEEQKGNWEWAVIDAIMYRNYESTEWNALDWAYHKNWGGGDKGFISQRNLQLKQQGKTELNYITYMEDPLIVDLLNFFKENFYLYRVDEYGIYYMHSLLPVDEDGDVSLGYVDESGVFKEYDSDGKRIKGFYYKNKQYTGRDIFKGLSLMAKDIRDYDLSSNNLSEIFEALTLLTAIYADNTTRIKPANLKEMKKKFGFSNILSKKGVTTLVVGHNPINKLDSSYEYVTLRFFNKEFKIINLVHIDGNMSSEYAPPKGAGLARLIGGGVSTRGFISGSSTEITSSATPDVTLRVFIDSALLNLFPFLKKILSFTEKLYNSFAALKQSVSAKFLKKSNTTLIGILTDAEEINNFENAHSKNIRTVAVAQSDLVSGITTEKISLEKVTLSINGTEISFDISLDKIKVANGFMNVITFNCVQNTEDADKDEILKTVSVYILEQISNKKYGKYLKNTKNIVLANDNFSDIFELTNRQINKNFAVAIEESFGIIPALYDIRNRKSATVITDLTNGVALDKIKTMLSAA